MRPYRTVLEQKIRERRQTFEEFVADVEIFAREHNEPGTLGLRHLQRLVAGRRPDGRPLAGVHVVTARLLEGILGVPIDELLAPPSTPTTPDNDEAELHQRLYAASQVDDATVTMLQDQLAHIRLIDRRLGATVAHEEALTKASQVATLLSHATSTRIRQRLASLLSELYCLAGWQALDLGLTTQSWHYYDLANSAAFESENYSFKALAETGRAFVLVDIGETATAVDLVARTQRAAYRTCSHLTRSWLAASHGEVLAADGNGTESLRAFDRASALLTTSTPDTADPYMALDSVHLARWRGHALARCGADDAVGVLADSLSRLDPTFTRAETALRVDLARAFTILNEAPEAATQVSKAADLATKIGSIRQQRRINGIIHSTQNPGS
ncbi:MAG TPA: hypothetical protein VFX16_15695 [Pseudonocardiaceae bacterium]|nr:hypothetical protein [Pseudonocardiaceae bacterium]